MKILVDGRVVQIGEQLPEKISTTYIEYHPIEASMMRIPLMQVAIVKRWLEQLKTKSDVININGLILIKENE